MSSPQVIPIRVPSVLKQALKAEAEKQGSDVSTIIREACKSYLAGSIVRIHLPANQDAA